MCLLKTIAQDLESLQNRCKQANYRLANNKSRFVLKMVFSFLNFRLYFFLQLKETKMKIQPKHKQTWSGRY